MKEKKTKNHKENWIGNIIRGFLLFMPLLAIGVTCAYAIFNKNAYKSYNNQNQNIYIEETSDFVINDKYYFSSFNNNATITENNIGSYNQRIYLTDVEIIVNQTSADLSNLSSIGFYKGASSNVVSFQMFDNTNTAIGVYTTQNNITIRFSYLSSAIYDYFYSLGIFYKTTQTNYLDNVFYYSIDKVQQSPLFNWSTDTGMYNVIHGACTTLGIESTFVPFLLSYWLLTYLIYIIYDIALLIVNMAHNRIHDVESSI